MDASDEVFPVKRSWALLGLISGALMTLSLLQWWDRMDAITAFILGAVGGIFLYGGIAQLVRPMIFAALRNGGIEFPSSQIAHVPWSHLRAVSAGPLQTPAREGGTVLMGRRPVVLHVHRDSLEMARRQALMFDGMRTLPDGSYECLIDTSQCPIPTEELLGRIERRLGCSAVVAGGHAKSAPGPISILERYGIALVISGIGAFFIFSAFLQVHRAAQPPRTLGSYWAAVDAAPGILAIVALGLAGFVWGVATLVGRASASVAVR